MEEQSNWHYAEKGKVIGPVSFDEVKTLIAAGKVKEDTSVWNGAGEWQAAKSTELSELFIQPVLSSIAAPPPLSGSDIDNKFVWLLVAVPLIGLLVDLLTGRKSAWVFVVILFALNTLFFILDERKLKGSGHALPKSKWIKVIPVYLWQRAIFLKQKNHYFWGWIATLILSIVLIASIHSSNIEDSACPLVTQIMHNQYGRDAAECKVVKIDEEVTDGFYKATAVLDNGRDVGITIAETKDNQIEVRLVRTPSY